MSVIKGGVSQECFFRGWRNTGLEFVSAAKYFWVLVSFVLISTYSGLKVLNIEYYC